MGVANGGEVGTEDGNEPGLESGGGDYKSSRRTAGKKYKYRTRDILRGKKKHVRKEQETNVLVYLDRKFVIKRAGAQWRGGLVSVRPKGERFH